MTALIPPPNACGLPAKYDSWRANQAEAAERAILSTKRFIGFNAPTGFGKSPVGMVIARYLNAIGKSRTCYMTANKGLMDQLSVRDFSGLVTDIRGKGNYPCQMLADAGQRGMCDRGPCADDPKCCSLKFAGCSYFDQQRAAKADEIVITNYDKWLTIRDPEEDGIGEFDTLILDEAHEAANQICKSMTVEVREDTWFKKFASGSLPSNIEPSAWKDWANALFTRLRPQYDSMNALLKMAQARGPVKPEQRNELYRLRLLVTALDSLRTISDDWVEVFLPPNAGGAPGRSWTPKWPAPYAEKLFRGAKKIIFMSATITRHELEKLGVPAAELDFIEYPSSFSPKRAPFIWIPTIPMKEPMSDQNNRVWVRRADEIFSARADRKSILGTGSFRRQKFYLMYSRLRDRCIFNDPKLGNTKEIVEQFRAAPPGTILVGPSFTEGWDFAFDQCECYVVVKIPLLDTTDPLTKARCLEDKKYSPRAAMEKLMQISGRGMRDEMDRCETFLMDDQWDRWFLRNNAQFAARWFLDRATKSHVVPKAPPKLLEVSPGVWIDAPNTPRAA